MRVLFLHKISGSELGSTSSRLMQTQFLAIFLLAVSLAAQPSTFLCAGTHSAEKGQVSSCDLLTAIEPNAPT